MSQINKIGEISIYIENDISNEDKIKLGKKIFKKYCKKIIVQNLKGMYYNNIEFKWHKNKIITRPLIVLQFEIKAEINTNSFIQKSDYDLGNYVDYAISIEKNKTIKILKFDRNSDRNNSIHNIIFDKIYDKKYI